MKQPKYPSLYQVENIDGSGFAIADYNVQPGLSGEKAHKRLRKRLSKRGLRLMPEYVPNHIKTDHFWIRDHPEYFVPGTESDLEQNPQNYQRVKSEKGDLILAYGRDPYFPGWLDTIQPDYSNPATVEATAKELLRISGQCDEVRCDIAMLILPEIFEKTWGRRAQPFWANDIITVPVKTPGFLFVAEVYWDMEWNMQREGFDYAYYKRLYDRLTDGRARAVREHFFAGLDYQDKHTRFLENHNEPRAATTFEGENHEAAAVITFLCPQPKPVLFAAAFYRSGRQPVAPARPGERSCI